MLEKPNPQISFEIQKNRKRPHFNCCRVTVLVTVLVLDLAAQNASVIVSFTKTSLILSFISEISPLLSFFLSTEESVADQGEGHNIQGLLVCMAIPLDYEDDPF